MKKFKEWIRLIKPRVSVLVLVTIIPGMYLGSDKSPSLFLIFSTIFGTFLMSSASFILNQFIEMKKDSMMKRTSDRPLPMGTIHPVSALFVAYGMIFTSFCLLSYFVNFLTAFCALSALLLYLFLYTIYLKPRTPQNIVIGGVSGCIGPLIGYAAVMGKLPIQSWILFLLIFLWTPAHFWALAIFLKEDYKNANFPMLPNIDGIEKTTNWILIYTILYSLTAISFYFLQVSMGLFYLLSVALLSAWIIESAIRLKKNQSPIFAKKFFFISIAHLFLLNGLIMIDHLII